MVAQNTGSYQGYHEEEPVSRTYQYRKVMKPMLERKRRARINRCLDELKELMVGALQAEGENVSKLEKADILELTVRHLHGLKRSGQLIAKPENSYAERFVAGFTQCATEVSQFIANATLSANALQRPGPVDPQAGARLLQHLTGCIRRLEAPQSNPTTVQPQQYQTIKRPQAVLATLENRGLKRPVPTRPDVTDVKRICYAPPSPPQSPAQQYETAQRAAPWRPW